MIRLKAMLAVALALAVTAAGPAFAQSGAGSRGGVSTARDVHVEAASSPQNGGEQVLSLFPDELKSGKLSAADNEKLNDLVIENVQRLEVKWKQEFSKSTAGLEGNLNKLDQVIADYKRDRADHGNRMTAQNATNVFVDALPELIDQIGMRAHSEVTVMIGDVTEMLRTVIQARANMAGADPRKIDAFIQKTYDADRQLGAFLYQTRDVMERVSTALKEMTPAQRASIVAKVQAAIDRGDITYDDDGNFKVAKAPNTPKPPGVDPGNPNARPTSGPRGNGAGTPQTGANGATPSSRAGQRGGNGGTLSPTPAQQAAARRAAADSGQSGQDANGEDLEVISRTDNATGHTTVTSNIPTKDPVTGEISTGWRTYTYEMGPPPSAPPGYDGQGVTGGAPRGYNSQSIYAQPNGSGGGSASGSGGGATDVINSLSLQSLFSDDPELASALTVAWSGGGPTGGGSGVYGGLDSPGSLADQGGSNVAAGAGWATFDATSPVTIANLAPIYAGYDVNAQRGAAMQSLDLHAPAPSAVMTVPSTQVNAPTAVMTVPSTQVNVPSAVMTVPSTQVNVPSQVMGPGTLPGAMPELALCGR